MMSDKMKSMLSLFKWLTIVILVLYLTYTMYGYGKRLSQVEQIGIQIGEIHKEIEGYKATIQVLDTKLSETHKQLGAIGVEIVNLKKEEQAQPVDVSIPQAVSETRAIIGSEEVLPQEGKVCFSDKAFLLNYNVLTDYITRGKIIDRLENFTNAALEANANLTGQNLALQQIQGKLQEELELEKGKVRVVNKTKPVYIAVAFLAGVAISQFIN